ncbi:MAG: hypothetical protein JRI23_22430 [Deltaproteobacteria bacterium]|jgi:hypothetical protein|nr:hypothetical protein [Deltaproteobacteria bacterium]MBW2534704.1 hypothetical protein [Deltaproteobacteria bacterium]
MAYRERQVDERWQAARELFDEQELPETFHQAFAAFEREMHRQAPAKPRLFELEHGSDVETYYPSYEAMKPEGMVSTVLMFLVMWLMGGGLVAAVGMLLGIFLMPDSMQQPVAIGFIVLGYGGVGALALRMVQRTWRHNRIKKAASGPIGFGTYLLAEAIIDRHPDGVSFYPRECVQGVEIERTAASSSSGGSTGIQHHQRAESWVCFRYTDALGRTKRERLVATAYAGHDEPEPARRLREWLGEGRDEEEESRPFGHAAAADLRREDYAARWRTFRRRRKAAWVALVGPWILFIVVPIVGHYIGNEMLDNLFGLPVVTVLALVAAPGLVAWGVYRGTKCPRCGKWPRQPLSGTKVTHCLSCGLPIFTKVETEGPAAS